MKITSLATYRVAPRWMFRVIETDEARVVHASLNAPDWHNPLWRHADGSVAEW
jgi:hypothetical protein